MFWTEKRDRVALAFWGTAETRKRYSAQDTADIIGHGCTRGMVIGRVSRLLGMSFPSTNNRLLATRRRQLRREYHRAVGLEHLVQNIKKGMPHADAIMRAKAYGVPNKEIAKALGYKKAETVSQQAISHFLRRLLRSPKSGRARAPRGKSDAHSARVAR